MGCSSVGGEILGADDGEGKRGGFNVESVPAAAWFIAAENPFEGDWDSWPAAAIGKFQQNQNPGYSSFRLIALALQSNNPLIDSR